MMKKTICLCAVASLLLLSTGCDSFLDEQPRGYAIPETTDAYNGMFNTIQFMNINMEDYTLWLNDDIQLNNECIDGLADAFGYSSFDPESILPAFRYERDIYKPTANCNAWEQCYKNVYTFNVIANGVMSSTGGTQAEKEALRAEARMSRAWMHFILAQMFARPWNPDIADTELTIPIVTEANTNVSSFERATMRELYDFITTEMEESCPLLEDRPDHNMRVYMTTGYGLLGKMYWMMGEYEKALAPLRTAYERSKNETNFHLLDFNALMAKYDYRELTADELSSEQMASGDYLLLYTYADPEILWVKQNPCFSNYRFWSYGLVTYYLKPEAYALFDDHDLRRNLIPTKYPSGEPTPYPVGCIRDGISPNYGVSLPEIYLALAECEARVGSEDNARQILTEFRSKRVRTGYEDVPATVQTRDDLVRFCWDEQRREFMGRMQRYYNLRRLWSDPLFQQEKPITHNDGTSTYTLEEDNLYLVLPEGVLKWNENWR